MGRPAGAGPVARRSFPPCGRHLDEECAQGPSIFSFLLRVARYAAPAGRIRARPEAAAVLPGAQRRRRHLSAPRLSAVNVVDGPLPICTTTRLLQGTLIWRIQFFTVSPV